MTPASFAVATPPVTASAPVVESAEDARIMMDFPPTPDDVRRQSQTISRLGRAGFAVGLSGLTVTVLGAVGLISGAYFCLAAAAEVDDSESAEMSRRLGYGLGGGTLLLSAGAVTFGLSQICRGISARRQAGQEITSLHARVQFAPRGEGRIREYR